MAERKTGRRFYITPDIDSRNAGLFFELEGQEPMRLWLRQVALRRGKMVPQQILLGILDLEGIGNLIHWLIDELTARGLDTTEQVEDDDDNGGLS